MVKRIFSAGIVMIALALFLSTSPLEVFAVMTRAQAVPAMLQQSQPVFESSDLDIKDGTAPVIAGGVAYLFAGEDPWMPPGVISSIVALNAANGDLIWQKELEWAGGMGSKAKPLVEGSRLFIGCGKSVYCLDTANNGNILWQTNITPPEGMLGDSVIISDPVAYTGTAGRVVVVGDYIYGNYVGLDSLTGNILWRYNLDAGSSAIGAPGVDDVNHRIYLPQHASFGQPVKGKIHCLGVTGASPVKIWDFTATYDVASPIAFHQGKIYFSDFAYGGPMSNFYCVEDKGNQAELVWQQEIWGSSGLSMLDPAGERVYVCGNDYAAGTNHFYAFDLNSGELAWDNSNWGAYNGSSALSPSTGYLYVGSFDTAAWAHNRGIAAVEPLTGGELWMLSQKGGGDPVVCNGLVYTTADGRLYAYQEFLSPQSYDWYFAEGYTGAGFDEWLCIANPGNSQKNGATVRVTFYFKGGRPPLEKEYPVAAGTRKTIYVNGEVGADMEVSIKVESDRPVVAERPVYFNYGRSLGGGSVVLGADRPMNRWLFAEGYTGAGFDEWLCMLNPGDSTTATVTYYYRNNPVPLQKNYELPAHSRETIMVNHEAGQDQEVSIEVTTPEGSPIVAERPIYFNYMGLGVRGGHCVMGVGEESRRWYFAEGYTGAGFDEWLCILNRGDANALVSVTYNYQGEAGQTKQYNVGARSRETINVNAEAGRGKNVSLLINSDQPVVAERPLYFSYGGKWYDGSCVMGTTIPSNYWVLAEGYTEPYFDEYICILNPGKEMAKVKVRSLFGMGTEELYEVEGGRRFTIALYSSSPVERTYAITSDRAVVVVRPMYFYYAGLGASGGHCERGATLMDIY